MCWSLLCGTYWAVYHTCVDAKIRLVQPSYLARRTISACHVACDAVKITCYADSWVWSLTVFIQACCSTGSATQFVPNRAFSAVCRSRIQANLASNITFAYQNHVLFDSPRLDLNIRCLNNKTKDVIESIMGEIGLYFEVPLVGSTPAAEQFGRRVGANTLGYYLTTWRQWSFKYIVH